MAAKKYAYYVKGNKIGIVQMDTTDVSAEDYGKYKSPTESVLDGAEVEYTYAPIYRLTSTTNVDCEAYTSSSGYLQVVDAESGLPSSGITHIVIRGSERFNGLHEISAFGGGGSLHTKTKYGEILQADSSLFEVYTNVEVMQDEDFDIDITRYQAQAVTYYLKAKLSEEAMDIEGREYWMRLFNKQLEQGANSKKYGPRIIQGYGGMND